MARSTANNATSTAQQLASVIKSARDIMRKDKGLSGDLDRLPMLTWIMFLKFLDDMEQVREAEATLRSERFVPAIEPPYRWRDWADRPGGITGDELIAFINQDEAVRPDGTRGPGLFAYLRSLQGADGGDRRDVIATVFRGTVNRMINGYLLRDVVDKINTIHFTSSDEVHTLGLLYESLLKEMRDAAGASGEFYTPRPVVQFIIAAVDPRLGETVLDPAAGTGGFLVAAFEYMKQQGDRAEDYETLQRGTLLGIEAKPLPYLLCQMNLLLHGLEAPSIDPLNALRFPLREIGDRDRVDVIITNPPFGGEEERGILANFPEDRQTAETALLFLQLIMRKLRRPSGHHEGGRCGMVVPNGVLFGDGICARIKKDLLDGFNLHTVVRLPMGVFAPYTPQPTNLLFFDRSGPTREIWYYEHPLPNGRKNYTKTQPLRFEEFAPCFSWWHQREESATAWRVSIEEVVGREYNLDIRNPRSRRALRAPALGILLDDVIKGSQEVYTLLNDLRTTCGSGHTIRRAKLETASIEELGITVNRETRNPAKAFPDSPFAYIDLSAVSMGTISEPKSLLGRDAPSRARRVVRTGDVVFSTVRPYLRGHAIVSAQYDGAICSTGFAVLTCPESVEPPFLLFMLLSPDVIDQCEDMMRGSHYPAINDDHVRRIRIPRVPREEQVRIVSELESLFPIIQAKVDQAKRMQAELTARLDSMTASLLGQAFRGEL